MNIIEVMQDKNVGKVYEIFIDGVSEETWELKYGFTTKEFEFFKDGKALTKFYFSSQIARMEFEEVIDWSKVPVDTKMLVSKDNEIWFRRYFAKYEDGKIYCFRSGASSFSADDEDDIMVWKYVKLYQE